MSKPVKTPNKRKTAGWTLTDEQCTRLRQLVSQSFISEKQFAKQVVIKGGSASIVSALKQWNRIVHPIKRRKLSDAKLEVYAAALEMEVSKLHFHLFSPNSQVIPQFQISDNPGRESKLNISDEAALKKYRRLLHLYHQCNEDDTSEHRNTYWTYLCINFSKKKAGCLYSEFEIPVPYNDSMPCSALGFLFSDFLTISFNSPYWIEQRKAHYLFFTKGMQEVRGHWGIIYYEKESHVGANACLITFERICGVEVAGRQNEKIGGALDNYWRELIDDHFGLRVTPLFKKLSQYRGT